MQQAVDELLLLLHQYTAGLERPRQLRRSVEQIPDLAEGRAPDTREQLGDRLNRLSEGLKDGATGLTALTAAIGAVRQIIDRMLPG